MEDDHVDRPGVEAQQCVQLTGTNCSIGLKVASMRMDKPHKHTRIQGKMRKYTAPFRPFWRPGGYGEGAPPDPISNSDVKPLSADGTAS